MKTKEYKYKVTPRIFELNKIVNGLSDNLAKILTQPFWAKKVSIDEKIRYINQLSSSKATLFEEVHLTYPQLRGKTYGVSDLEIKSFS